MGVHATHEESHNYGGDRVVIVCLVCWWGGWVGGWADTYEWVNISIIAGRLVTYEWVNVSIIAGRLLTFEITGLSNQCNYNSVEVEHEKNDVLGVGVGVGVCAAV